MLVALVTLLGAAQALAASPVWYYLVGDSEPIGSLSTSEPPSIPLPNYDPERDTEPGLVLKKTNGGAGETEATKYQHWEVAAPPGELIISLVLWAAVKDFDPDKTGRLGVYLLDCAASCQVIETVYQTVSGPTWSRVRVSFSGSHTFAVGHRLALKVVVQANSDDDMWLAYGTFDYDSSIQVRATNASTTTTTTTTTIPPTTTTPPTTTATTTPPTTTTTIPGPTSSTSLTTPTIDPLSPPTTTTTTTIDPLSPPTTTATTAPLPTVTTTVGSPESESDQTVTAGGPDDPNLPPPPQNPGVVQAISAQMGMATAIPVAMPVSPQEGLQVVFNAAVQTLATNSVSLLALLLVAGLLLLARLSDDDDEDETRDSGRRVPRSWWFYS